MHFIYIFLLLLWKTSSLSSLLALCAYMRQMCVLYGPKHMNGNSRQMHTHTHIVLLWEPYRRAIQTHTHRHSCKRGKGARNISLSIESPAQYTVAVYSVTSLRHKNQYGGLNRTERADFYSVLFSISFELDVIFYLLYAFTGWNFRLLIRQKQETSKRIKKIFIK